VKPERARLKIYTRTGDEGTTSLFGGTRVEKSHARIEAYGTVDELSSWLGLAIAAGIPGECSAELLRIQADLFEIGAHLASVDTSRFPGVSTARIAELETAIDAMESELTPLTRFILPGGNHGAASLHIARTVCRRAERRVVALQDESAATTSSIAFLNRLSDYLFVAARFTNKRAGIEDTPWER
jgi:cob(I)alamin adenosyltransferase